jgi:peroxiredoxin
MTLTTFVVVIAADHGPPVGAPMPSFEAQDQNGKTHTLESLLGPNGAAIVFFRSADW